MSIYRWILLGSICYMILCSQYIGSERLKNKIYININQVQACFRKLNATGQFGCSSDISGSIGVVYLLQSESDLNWLIDKGPNAPYVVMLNTFWFTKEVIDKLRSSGKVSGMILNYFDVNLPNATFPKSGFSYDSTCPLDDFGLYKNDKDLSGCKVNVWNPTGNSLLYEDLKMPIFVVTNKTESELIVNECYKRFNERSPDDTPRSYPLCAAELRSFMYGAKDTRTCLWRSKHITNLEPQTYCDKLNNHNVFGVSQNLSSSMNRSANSVTVLGTRIDTGSLFINVTPSADMSVTGVVALLSIARSLKSSGIIDNIRSTDKDLMFAFFHGETYDYIGSSRVVYDMELGNFPGTIKKGEVGLSPISLEHLDKFVELAQLGHYENGLHAFYANFNQTNVSLKDDYGLGVKVTEHHKQPLPPASVQRFLMKRRIPAVVYTDHGQQYSNIFYNSHLDVAVHINASYPPDLSPDDQYDFITPQAENLANISTIIARNVAKMVANISDVSHVNVDVLEVSHLLYCFLFNANCSLFRTVMHPENVKYLSNSPLPLFISVIESDKILVSSVIANLLAFYIGDVRTDLSKSTCKKGQTDKIMQYFWIKGANESKDGICVTATVGVTSASSPAFEIEGYDMTSGEYSTWSESVWDDIGVRIFLIPSRKFEITVLLIGVLILLVSHAVVFFINRNVVVLFGNELRTTSGISTT